MALVSFSAGAFACSGQPGQVAWPLQSPLGASASEDLNAPKPLSVPMAPMGFVAQSGDAVQICLDGAAHWVPAGSVAVSDGDTAVIAPAQLAAARPDLQFWANEDAVSGFLGGRGTAPAFVELRGDPAATPRVLPLVARAEFALGRRSINVGEMLIGVHRDAATSYAAINENSGSGSSPIVVIDASLSAAAFSQRFLKRLGQNLRESDVLLADVRPAFLASDNQLTLRGTTNLAELAGAGVPAMAAAAPVDLAASKAALDMADVNLEDRADLLVLAGGDVRIVDLDPDRFNDIRIVNVVPELHDALRDGMPDTARYIPFSNTAIDELAADLVEDPDFRPPLGERLADFGGVAQAQADHGFLAMIPFDAAPGHPLVTLPDGADWVAIRAWTVLNPDVFSLGAAQ